MKLLEQTQQVELCQSHHGPGADHDDPSASVRPHSAIASRSLSVSTCHPPLPQGLLSAFRRCVDEPTYANRFLNETDQQAESVRSLMQVKQTLLDILWQNRAARLGFQHQLARPGLAAARAGEIGVIGAQAGSWRPELGPQSP